MCVCARFNHEESCFVGRFQQKSLVDGMDKDQTVKWGKANAIRCLSKIVDCLFLFVRDERARGGFAHEEFVILSRERAVLNVVRVAWDTRDGRAPWLCNGCGRGKAIYEY